MADKEFLESLRKGDQRVLAKAISMVENETEGSKELLSALTEKPVQVAGITGPPGAGKSTLISALLSELTATGKRVAVIAVDPTSPFTQGSLLGDRLRMSEHFTHPSVFIRSIATRGALGGLSKKAEDILKVLRASDFDLILLETVGVGQSEVEVAALADTTVLVLVPEAGDEIQTIKSGVMEIADIFVVNKSDREGADLFAKNLEMFVHERPASDWNPPVLLTSALRKEGIAELAGKILEHFPHRDHAKKEKVRKFLGR